jgi:predicted dithiol-disulfide oxidoreductase (DUF899 family)
MTTHITGTTAMPQASIQNHRVVSWDEWVAERKTLLAHEKELTRFGDQITRERRALPWVRIDKTYKFDSPMGCRTLTDLFDGRRQLLVQHLMLAPGWEQACKNCSYMADHTDGAIVHLAQRDVTFVAVSRAPLSEIEGFRQRMGWKFAWVSSHSNDFNRDFHVSFMADEMANGTADYNFGGMPAGEEMPGVSVFWKDDTSEVFHTYSTYGRGVCSISPPRVATRTGVVWDGCATTTGTCSAAQEQTARRAIKGRLQGWPPFAKGSFSALGTGFAALLTYEGHYRALAGGATIPGDRRVRPDFEKLEQVGETDAFITPCHQRGCTRLLAVLRLNDFSHLGNPECPSRRARPVGEASNRTSYK